MNEVDEILGTNEKKQKSHDYSQNRINYTWKQKKNSWKEQQAQDRRDIYKTMDRMAMIVGNDCQKFRQYLDVQSRFPKYSVGNCLVLLEKAPDSTRIKDESSWNENGVELVSNPKGIKILEPNKVNNKIYYNPKVVYDVSQTNAPKEEVSKRYDDRNLLEAIIKDCDVPRKAVEQLRNGSLGSEYSKEENILYVCKGMDRELLFQTLFQELGNIETRDEESSDIKSFRSYCVSYMLCQKYGVNAENFDFNNLPKEVASQREPKAIRGELNRIKNIFENIESRISNHFERNSQEKNKIIPER